MRFVRLLETADNIARVDECLVEISILLMSGLLHKLRHWDCGFFSPAVHICTGVSSTWTTPFVSTASRSVACGDGHQHKAAYPELESYSLRRHEHRQRHADELVVLADRSQRAAHIASNLIRVALFDPQRQLHDRGS